MRCNVDSFQKSGRETSAAAPDVYRLVLTADSKLALLRGAWFGRIEGLCYMGMHAVSSHLKFSALKQHKKQAVSRAIIETLF